MEKAKQNYTIVTGKELESLSLMGKDTAKNMAQTLSRLYGGHFTESIDLKNMIYWTITKTNDGYNSRLLQITKDKKSHYGGENIPLPLEYFDAEIQASARKLKHVGDSITHYHEGHNSSEISGEIRQEFNLDARPSVNKSIDKILASTHLTESELKKDHPFEIRGDDKTGYVVDVKVLNTYGLHTRPAALIVNTVMKYDDCNVALKYEGNTATGKGIMGIMCLGAVKNSDVILEADGPDSKQCLEDLVDLFSRKFDED